MEDEKKTTVKTKSTRTKNTKAKKTQAKPKNVKLTFRPLYSATSELSIRLKKTVTRVVNGQEMLVEEPLIKGLDPILTIKQNDVIEVTPEQLAELQKINVIESDEERAHRQSIEQGIKGQHPERLSWEAMKDNINSTVPMRDIDKIYANKLTILE